MFATLVVMLPSEFQGGELVVRHKGKEIVFDFAESSAFEFHYLVFYADCEHEIKPVTRGYRLCLVYNLCCKRDSAAPLPSPSDNDTQIMGMVTALKKWAANEVFVDYFCFFVIVYFNSLYFVLYLVFFYFSLSCYHVAFSVFVCYSISVLKVFLSFFNLGTQ